MNCKIKDARKRGTGRHKDITGFSKVLVPTEMNQIADWLLGRRPHAITGVMLDVNTIKAKQTLTIYNMMLCAGLRETELASLRIKDCPCVLNADVIEVYMGKGRKSRTVPVCDSLKKLLTHYIEHVRPTIIPRWISKSDVTKPVFYNLCGRPFLQSIVKRDKKKREIEIIRASTALYRLIVSIGIGAGLSKRLHPHMLRHTFAVEALKKGVTEIDLMGMMGHASMETTQKYIHLLHLSPGYLTSLKGKLENVAI